MLSYLIIILHIYLHEYMLWDNEFTHIFARIYDICIHLWILVYTDV